MGGVISSAAQNEQMSSLLGNKTSVDKDERWLREKESVTSITAAVLGVTILCMTLVIGLNINHMRKPVRRELAETYYSLGKMVGVREEKKGMLAEVAALQDEADMARSESARASNLNTSYVKNMEYDLEEAHRMLSKKDDRIHEITEQLSVLQAKLETKAHNHVQPSEASLLLDEIPFDKNAPKLDSPDITSLPPFTLHHPPDTKWYQRAKHIFDTSAEQLANAQMHVDDARQRTTLVTTLLNLGRGDAKMGNFRRKFDEYIQRFQRTVDVDFPMIVFMDAAHVSSLKMELRRNGCIIIPFTQRDLEVSFPEYKRRIDEIRSSGLYRKQAHMTGWLETSPQASLNDYDLLVMTKPFLLRWAAQINPWRTQYLTFVDAGHDCVGAFKTDHLDLHRKLEGRLMVSFFNYTTGLMAETHGMPEEAYRTYVGPPHDNPATWDHDDCCRVVRGGVFGGTPAFIDVFARIYNVLLSQTLSDGYLGTEENILGALLYRFPTLFNAWENVRDNCDVFVDAGERNPPDRDIYVQGSPPAKWDFQARKFTLESGSRIRTPLPTARRSRGGKI